MDTKNISEAKISFFKWYDLIIILVHAATVSLAFVYEILPHIVSITPALAAVIWIIYLTFSWTLYLFFRFKQHKKNFESKINELSKKADIFEEQKKSFQRQSRYAEVIDKLNAGFANIHSLMRLKDLDEIISVDLNKITDKKILEEYLEKSKNLLHWINKDLQYLCDEISDSFNHICGVSNVAVCIKIFRSEDPLEKLGCSVYTLVRDRDSETKRGHEKEKNITHWIRNNTAYLSAYEKLDMMTERCFYCESLPTLKEYNNTSFQIYGYPKTTIVTEGATRDEVVRAWTLPYFSTIVAPLCPLKINEPAKKNIIGYLCVDSPTMRTFRKYDQALILGLADGVFNAVKQCIYLIEKGNKIQEKIQTL